MRKLIVLLLLTTGLVAAGHAFRGVEETREERLAAVTRILTSPVAGTLPNPREITTKPDDASEPPWPAVAPELLAPPTRIIATDLATGRAVETAPPRPVAIGPLPPAGPGSQPAGAMQIQPWTTTVSGDPPAVATPAPRDRYRLVRTIQRELKRVRCYTGPIDGSWGERSKAAMQRFIERANASLPIIEPDNVLLTLLQAHASVTCGTCPAGQTLVDGSRCIPNAILAKTDKSRRPGETIVASSRETPGANVVTGTLPAGAPREPLPGLMAIGGPVTPPADGGRAPSTAVVAALETEEDVSAASPPTAEGEDGAGIAAPGDNGAPPKAGPRPGAPRFTAPRPARIVARPSSRQREARRNPRGTRSVQSLFTHPLGRL